MLHASCVFMVHGLHMITFYRTTSTEKSSEVEIQHIKHSTVKETEAQDDDHDKMNVYENLSDEMHRMSTCPAYDTIKI